MHRKPREDLHNFSPRELLEGVVGDLFDCRASSRQGGTLLKVDRLSSFFEAVLHAIQICSAVIVSRRVCVFLPCAVAELEAFMI